MKTFRILIFILSLILVFTQYSFAQGFEPVSKKGLFNIGIEGAVQFTSINNFSSFYVPSSKVGYTTGLFGEYYVSNDFKIKLAALYDSRPFEITGNTIFPDTSGQYLSNSYYLYQVDYKMNYLTIPIGIGYERGSDKFKILLQVNFYYSLLLNATMKGGELYYFEPSDGYDLSETTLHQGLNEFQLSGTTTGVTFNNISKESTEPYRYDTFNSSDFGFGLMIGGLYQPTPVIGISLSVGFSYSLGQAFENPQIDSKWSQITKINLGVVYTLFKK